METKKVELEVGDKVVDLKSGEEGIVARLCSDVSVVHVRWGSGSTQQMVEISSLKKKEVIPKKSTTE